MRSILTAFLSTVVLSGFAADAVWQGADGAALNDAANWTGNPFYDATTNATTDALFNADANACLTDDMAVYRMKLSKDNQTLVFNLGSHYLNCADRLVNYNSKKNARVTVKDGILRSASSGSSGTVVTFDNVCYTGNVSAAGYSTTILTNGTKMVGYGYWGDSVTSNKFIVTGADTVMDCNTLCIAPAGRMHTGPATGNEFIIAGGAVVTNMGGTKSGAFEQNVCGIWGKDNLIEMRDNSVFWMNESGDFRLGADSNSKGIGGNRLRILSGSKALIRYLYLGYAFSHSNLCEVAGAGTSLTLLETTGIGRRTSNGCRLWVRDHATLKSGNINVGGADNDDKVWDASLVIEDHATLNSSDTIQVGPRNSNYRSVFRVDSCSTVTCYRVFAGVENAPRTNLVWVGDSSAIKTFESGTSYVRFNSGAATTLVLSNGLFRVGNRCDFGFNNGNTLIFAGSHPRLEAGAIALGGNKVVFQIPAEGVDAGHALINPYGGGNFDVNNCTPSFEMKDFVKSPGGTITLVEMTGAGSIINFNTAKPKWEAALDEACAGWAKYKIECGTKTLKIILKRKKGLSILVR